ncbi:Uncharacterised protein [uncultured archaeon]|nr:Uncharacterised protein [uncultured archaeon]
MAEITVAPPVVMSPPAQTPSMVVRPSSSTTRVPHLVVFSSGVLEAISGLGVVPTAIMTVSTSTMCSEPFFTLGLLRPLASGSPSSIFTASMALTMPRSSPKNLVGFVRKSNMMPSSWAFSTSSSRAGISSLERR